MKSRIVLLFFFGVCVAVQHVAAQCDLGSNAKDKSVPFPNIEKLGVESYQMSVEYVVPKAEQSDYYTEYYDLIKGQGRIDSHIAGKSSSYLYKTYSWEAWEISSDQILGQCKLQNITDTPNLFKDDQTDWLYLPKDQPERRTIGPSAMFKIAYDAWNTSLKEGKMAYMGKSIMDVRGVNVHYWRRCDTPTSYVDYFFAFDTDNEDPYGLGAKIPLRVTFNGSRSGKLDDLSEQQYEIMNFQPYISLNEEPFQLPKLRGCKRGYLDNPPKLPDYSASNLLFNAEVIYRKIDRNGDDAEYWSYYSTLQMALDVESQHVGYFFTPWELKSTKPTPEPEAQAPVFEVYDMKHHYLYKYSPDNGNCEITRTKDFIPKYELPDEAGTISLTDPSILFPNSELTYLTEGTNRGLKVNIFEEVVENYDLGDITAPKAIISHSYLKDDEIERNTVSIKNSLTQVQLMLFGRQEKISEMVSLNFFGFTTELTDRRNIFNIQRCYKNEDDYTWVTLVFSADQSVLQKVKKDIPTIQSNILNSIKLMSELNAVRVPVIQVDFKPDGIYVNLLILGKPPVLLDYLEPEDGKVIVSKSEDEGVENVIDCATNCLEEQDDCWGFSICGAVCTYGTGTGATIVDAKTKGAKNCKLYRRFDNTTFIPSRAKMVLNLRSEVQAGQLRLMVPGNNNEMIQLDATSILVTDPGEDDRLFDRIGNVLNPRMRVLKTGYKLKATSGGMTIKNMGRLHYDECQRICLDFKACETMSYCLVNSECYVSTTYGEDVLKNQLIEENNMCNVLVRKYADNFNRSPGNVLSLTAEVELKESDVEGCARACLQRTDFTCLSFDHCPVNSPAPCKLHTVHYPNPKTREKVQVNASNCGHYYRKFSTEFKRTSELRAVGTPIAPLSNLTLEECAKTCWDFSQTDKTCLSFDFCQDARILATTCTILTDDPSNLKTAPSPICNHYERAGTAVDDKDKDKIVTVTRPFSNSYGGGIGFLCFLIGGLVGAGIVFGIAYFRVNRR